MNFAAKLLVMLLTQTCQRVYQMTIMVKNFDKGQVKLFSSEILCFFAFGYMWNDLFLM